MVIKGLLEGSNLVGTISEDKLIVLEPFAKMEGFLCQLLLNT